MGAELGDDTASQGELILGKGIDGDSFDGSDRALRPAAFLLESGLPQWTCPVCHYRTPGTIDAPIEGDGTCPQHPRHALVPANEGSTPAAS
jgi:hypothetical protein